MRLMRRDRFTTIAWVTTLFIAVTIVIAYPLSVHPASTSFGSDPDVHTFTWTLAWDVHALTDRPLHIFDANIFYPYDHTLAFSENLIGSVIFAAPAIWLTGNPVLAMNAVSLASCVLCALGAFCSRAGLASALQPLCVCGLIFAFSSGAVLPLWSDASHDAAVDPVLPRLADRLSGRGPASAIF